MLEDTDSSAENQPTIFVVDDDPGVSRAMESVGQLLGLPVAPYASGAQFLAEYDPKRPGCLVLDVRMPRHDGNRAAAAFRVTGRSYPDHHDQPGTRT